MFDFPIRPYEHYTLAKYCEGQNIATIANRIGMHRTYLYARLRILQHRAQCSSIRELAMQWNTWAGQNYDSVNEIVETFEKEGYPHYGKFGNNKDSAQV